MTASITMMPAVTRRVRPPRALAVPFPLGFPLGRPNAPALQRRIVEALLALCASEADVPHVAPYEA